MCWIGAWKADTQPARDTPDRMRILDSSQHFNQREITFMDLKEYEQEKFVIADIIRSAQAVDTKDETLQSECRDLLTRLAEDRFNLLVVGRFSRGKSTLMPACCLPHLALVTSSLGAGKPARNLLHARLLDRTAEDLQRYALRHDALRR